MYVQMIFNYGTKAIQWEKDSLSATQEAKAEELLDLGGRGCSELRLHRCTPAWATELDSTSKKHTKNCPIVSHLAQLKPKPLKQYTRPPQDLPSQTQLTNFTTRALIFL